MAFDASTWADTRTAEGTPKRWRNKYRAIEAGDTECGQCGLLRSHNAGDEFFSHCITYQTQAEAEQMRLAASESSGFEIEYLGAFPEGERP